MNKADLLMASLRQLAAGNIVASRGSSHNALTAKDGKDKAAQFHEQLRLISQGVKHAVEPAVEITEPDALQAAEDAVRIADAVAQPASARPKDKAKQASDGLRHSKDEDSVSAPHDWRGPEAALSAVMSKLDQAPKVSPNEDDGTVRVAEPGRHNDPRVAHVSLGESAKSVAADEASDQNVTLSVGSVNTRSASPVKVVVRQQETHFEPVQQLTQLQRIVDHVATDLPATGAPSDTALVNAAPQDMLRVADKPVKILTVQLDPPSLGTVTVKVRMTGDAVDVQVSADRYETTQMLRHERDALTERMHSAGYRFEISSIDHNRVADVAASGQTPSRSDHQQSSQQQSQGGAHINGGNSERQSSDAQAGARQNRQGHDQFAERVARNRDQEPAQDRTGGAVYL